MAVRSPLKEIAVNTHKESSVTSEQRANFNKYIHEAKKDVEKENLYSAWTFYKKAYTIVPSEKVASKIGKLEMHMTTYNLWPNTKENQHETEVTKTNTEDDNKVNHDPPQDKTAGSDVNDVVTPYNALIHKAKAWLQKDEVYQAYLCFQDAQLMHPTEKMERKLSKMKVYLTENNLFPAEHKEANENDKMMEVTPEGESHQPEQGETPDTKENKPDDVLDSDKVNMFRKCVKEAKELLKENHFHEALDLYQKANSIMPGDEVQKRIRKIENYIRENDISRPENERNQTPETSKVKPTGTDLKTPRESNQAHRTENSEHASPQPETDESEGENDEDRFRSLYQKAKSFMESDQYKEALSYYKQAQALIPSDKLQRRINKLQDHLAEQEEEVNSSRDEVDDDMVHVGNGFYLFKDMCGSLYAHQRQGILWMWSLYKQRKGGILGDDMGLGKTIQVIGFLSGMFDAEKIKGVLIVLPVAVIVNWEREFEKWAPGLRIDSFHGPSKSARERAMQKMARKGGVMLTSYGMLQRPQNTALLTEVNGREFVWDYVILDEGHKIKNPSNKCSKGVHSIPARNRLLLTGTPIQNNLKELWTLFDWTHQGSLLGSAKTFSMQFEQPITRARQKDATAGEHRLGQEIANSLKGLIQPFFMRRTKAEVSRGERRLQRQEEKDGEGGERPHMPTMTRKNDLICWVFLSDTQQRIYEDFNSQPDVKQLLNSSQSPLTALNQLKKICDHPRLMTNTQCLALGLHMDEGIQRMETLDEETSKESAVARINHIPDHILVDESGKLRFLVQLLDNLRDQGHRCLVFSQSRKMLDIIQKVMGARGHKIARLDGTIRHLYEREDIIKRFSKDRSYSIFLLTTQVGGVGLTLTAADRVVIFDPSWNPATDAQAVDRAFRIGQDKNVVIYRLITCGSVEEKIYRRQIFKDSITKQTTGDSTNPYRYFSRQELRELFVLDNPKQSATQVQLTGLHDGQRNTDTHLDEHIAFLHTLDMFGISDHDLMFNKEAHHSDESEEEGNDYIQHRVAQANRLIALEAEENLQQTQQTGKYAAPEVFAEKSERPSRAAGMFTNPVTSPPSPEVIPVDNESGEDSLNKTMGHMHIQEKHSSQSDESSDAMETNPNHSGRSDHSNLSSSGVGSSPSQAIQGASNHGNDSLDMRNHPHMSEEEQIRMAMQMSMLEARETEKRILAQIQKNSDDKNPITVDTSIDHTDKNGSYSAEEDISPVKFTSEINADGSSSEITMETVEEEVVLNNDGSVNESINIAAMNQSGSTPGKNDISGNSSDIALDTVTEEAVVTSNGSVNNKSVIEESLDSFKSLEDRDTGDDVDKAYLGDNKEEKNTGAIDDHSVIITENNSKNENQESLIGSEADSSTNENVHHSVQVSFSSAESDHKDPSSAVSSGDEDMEASSRGNKAKGIESLEDSSSNDEDTDGEDIVEEDKGAQVSFSSSSDNEISKKESQPAQGGTMYKDLVSSDDEDVGQQDDVVSDDELPSLNVMKKTNTKRNNVIASDSESESETDEMSKNSKNESMSRKVLVEESDSDESMELGGDNGKVDKNSKGHGIFVHSDGTESDDDMEAENKSEVKDIDRSRSNDMTVNKEQKCKSPQKSSATVSGVVNKRALTPRETPVSNKRRRSVNVGLTPHKVVNQTAAGEHGVGSPRPVVVQEELIFSPRGNEPQVTTTQAKDDWFSGEGELEYKEFEKQVESSSNIANSTRMYDNVSKNIFPGSRAENKVTQHSDPGVSEEGSEEESEKSESEESESEDELSREDLERYVNCIKESRKFYKTGDLQNALRLVKEALQIYAEEEQVRKYALKLQKKAAEAMQS